MVKVFGRIECKWSGLVDKAAVAKSWDHASETFDNIFFLDDLGLENSPLFDTLFVDIVENDLLFDGIDDRLEEGYALRVLAEEGVVSGILEGLLDLVQTTLHNIIISFKSFLTILGCYITFLIVNLFEGYKNV